MSGKTNGCVVSVVTRAGVPILTIPSNDKANIFAMLVYSLINFASALGVKTKTLSYDIRGRKLHILLAEKTFLAIYVPGYLDMKARRFLELSSSLLEKLNNTIVEEGVIDDTIIRMTREEIMRIATSSGIPIGGITTFRKVCGDLYGELLSRGVKGDIFRGYFRVGYFPRLLNHRLIEREKNPLLRRVLELCDGNNSVAYICDTLGIPESKLYRFIAGLLGRGLMTLEVGFELVDNVPQDTSDTA